MRGERGQLVLLAAAALAIALVPMALAYLQLGYHDDVQSTTVDTAPVADAERTLQRRVDEAGADIPASYSWPERSQAVTAVRGDLRPTLETLNTSRLDTGTALDVAYNHSRARSWARSHCPSGPARQFGSCRADRGVVVQNRTGRTHPLAVAADVDVTTPDGTWRATVLVRNVPRSS